MNHEVGPPPPPPSPPAPTSCAELTTGQGVRTVTLASGQTVSCDTDTEGGPWTVVQVGS